MGLRAREPRQPEIALARQRAEQDLIDLQRTRNERLAGIERLRVARHGPVRHVASCLVMPPATAAECFPELADEPDAALRRQIELAAEDLVVAYEDRPWARMRTSRPPQDRVRHSEPVRA